MKHFTLPKEEHIKYIINNFNFQQVHNVMKFLDWTWAGSSKIPSICELKKEATRLLNEVYDSNEKWIATGGFKASKYYDFLELEFIVTDWSSYIINHGDRYEKMKKIRKNKKKLKIRKKKLIKIEKLNEYENN
jgi:hypothetical protein